MKVSVRPSTFQEGGSLIDNVDVTVKQAQFQMYDYGGKGPTVPALGLILTDADGVDHDVYLGLGGKSELRPSKDGTTKADAGDFLVGDEAVRSGSNFGVFMESLVNAGFPEDKLDDFAASGLQGLQFHLLRQAQKRGGLIRTGKNADRQDTAVTCSKIIKLPWENKTAAAGKPNGKVAAAPADDAELRATVEEHVMGALMEAPDNKLAKAKLATAVFQALKGKPQAAPGSKLAMDDSFLSSISGLKLEGGIVSLAG